jgi:hypothetical protein
MFAASKTTTIIDAGIWKGWTKTDRGYERVFEGKRVQSFGGYFYVDGVRYDTLKEALAGSRSRRLDELLAQCNPNAPVSQEDRDWLDAPAAGDELI